MFQYADNEDNELEKSSSMLSVVSPSIILEEGQAPKYISTGPIYGFDPLGLGLEFPEMSTLDAV